MFKEDKYGVCPYNDQHKIVLFRMPGHILKCRKNYTGPALEQCIYNATHLVPMGTMAEHLDKCRDFYTFNGSALEKIAERSQIKASHTKDLGI